MTDISTEERHVLRYSLASLTRLGAQMHLIAQGLQRISQRWSDFQAFFEHILDSGDTLMRPTEHDNLLFDDGEFSRSRRFAWAISCLSEFDFHITDNLTQWELWRQAHVEGLLKENQLTGSDILQYRNAEQQCRILVNQREYFRQKRVSTGALRDAVSSPIYIGQTRLSRYWLDVSRR